MKQREVGELVMVGFFSFLVMITVFEGSEVILFR